MTDSPCADSVMYSELSDFFYVWLREALKDRYLELRVIADTSQQSAMSPSAAPASCPALAAVISTGLTLSWSVNRRS